MAKNQRKIGEILIDDGLIDKDQLDSAMEQQRNGYGKLASIINRMGSADEKSIAFELGKQLGLEYVTLDDKTILPEVLNKVKPELAEKYCIIPVEFIHNTLTIAMSDPTDLKALDEMEFTLGVKIKPVLALEHSIRKAHTKYYRDITYDPPLMHTTDSEEKPDKMEILRFENSKNALTYPNKAVIDAIAEILIEKNIVSRAEFLQKIRKKTKNNP